MGEHNRTDERASSRDGSAPLDLMTTSAQAGLRSRSRVVRWWIVAAIIAGVVALGAGLYGVISYDSARSWRETANDWQQYAEELEAEFDELEANRDGLADELEATEEELAATEDELHETEDRLAEVTAEREAARDAVAFRADEADLTAAIRTSLGTCVNDLFTWLDRTPPYDTDDATWDSYFTVGQEIAAVCADAQASFDGFAQALEPANR